MPTTEVSYTPALQQMNGCKLQMVYANILKWMTRVWHVERGRWAQHLVNPELLNYPDRQGSRVNFPPSVDSKTWTLRFLLTGNLNLTHRWHLINTEEFLYRIHTVYNLWHDYSEDFFSFPHLQPLQWQFIRWGVKLNVLFSPQQVMNQSHFIWLVSLILFQVHTTKAWHPDNWP